MKICQVFHRDYPWDVRVEKISRSLINNGNEIHLICNNSKQEPKEEFSDGIYIHRLPSLKSKKLNQLITFPAFFNIYWIVHILKITKRHRFDAFLVRDLPLVLPTWLVSKQFKTPLVYDMAENFPAMLQNFASLLKSPFLASILETIAIRIADHVIVVIEESMDRIIQKGVTPSKVSVVSNTPQLDLLKNNMLMHQKHVLKNDRVNLLYVGYITDLRGLDVVVKAIPTLVRHIHNVNLTIVGDGFHLRKLKKLAVEMNLQDYVDFTGWLDFKYVPFIISKCDIGVIPHYSNDHTDSTIPNKLFDYMAFAKPIIVSDAKPLKRIVQNLHCGVIFRSGDVDDFARKLIKLAEGADKAQMGKQGEVAVREIYNWDKDAERLCRVFEGFKFF